MHNPNFSWLSCHMIFKHSCFIISIGFTKGNSRHGLLFGVGLKSAGDPRMSKYIEQIALRCVIGLVVLPFPGHQVDSPLLSDAEFGLGSVFGLDTNVQGFVGSISPWTDRFWC